MTVIRPNSISGVTSITSQGGDINLFRADGTKADVPIVNNITAGVVTATKFVGPIEGNITGGTINATSGTITGNLGVGGVLTYEDVTNIDSVGIITARTDVLVGSTIKLGASSGIITATSFVGSGANLTGIDATKIITGNTQVQTIDTGSDGHIKFTTEGTERLRITHDAKIGIGTVSPAVAIHHFSDGLNGNSLRLENREGSITLTNDADILSLDANSFHFRNASGSTEKLRIDASGRLLLGTTTEGHDAADNLTIADSGNCGITIRSGTSNNGNLYFSDGTSGGDEYRGYVNYNHSSNYMILATNGSERLRINSNGSVGINTISADDPNNPGLHIHGSASDNCRISFTTPTKSNPGSRIGYYGLSNRFGMDVYNGFEIRDVAASYATRFRIDNNGYMTTNQPYGYVRFNTISDTAGENRQTNVYTHTVENGMSHSGGRLTVPATGKYYIGIHGNILDNNSAAQYLYINGSKQDGWRWQQNDTTQYWKSSMVGGIVGLTANDYLDIYVVGQQDNQAWNMWTVYMIG